MIWKSGKGRKAKSHHSNAKRKIASTRYLFSLVDTAWFRFRFGCFVRCYYSVLSITVFCTHTRIQPIYMCGERRHATRFTVYTPSNYSIFFVHAIFPRGDFWFGIQYINICRVKYIFGVFSHSHPLMASFVVFNTRQSTLDSVSVNKPILFFYPSLKQFEISKKVVSTT